VQFVGGRRRRRRNRSRHAQIEAGVLANFIQRIRRMDRIEPQVDEVKRMLADGRGSGSADAIWLQDRTSGLARSHGSREKAFAALAN